MKRIEDLRAALTKAVTDRARLNDHLLRIMRVHGEILLEILSDMRIAHGLKEPIDPLAVDEIHSMPGKMIALSPGEKLSEVPMGASTLAEPVITAGDKPLHGAAITSVLLKVIRNQGPLTLGSLKTAINAEPDKMTDKLAELMAMGKVEEVGQQSGFFAIVKEADERPEPASSVDDSDQGDN